MPDEWAAVHYGWVGTTTDERPDQTENEDSDSWSGDNGRAEVERDTTRGGGLTAPSATSGPHAGSSTDGLAPAPVHGKGSKGKTGGKGKSKEPNDEPKDPPMKDEYDEAQR